jgi:hypothetical protein
VGPVVAEATPMRLAFHALLLIGLVGCIDHPDAPVLPPGSDPLPTASNSPQQKKEPSQQDAPPVPAAKPALEVLSEVTYVLMKDWDGNEWMCTGTLVSKDIVVTAAHCLDESQFMSWEIVAPLAADQPRVSASSPLRMSDGYEDAAEPDIGFLRLDDPIDLPAYAELTDVSARVEKGEKLTATTIVRTAEEHEAPFKSVDKLTLSSTTQSGYLHGFATQYFSHGGDSGTGLFLVENGEVTHKLVGVARQPEQDAQRDHFTRIDANFLDWFHSNTAE